MDNSEQSEGFKVVDKRRFATDADAKEEPLKPSPASDSTTATDQPPSADHEKPEFAEEPLPPVSFSMLIMNLANTALLQLGLIRMPEDQGPEQDLVGARRTIDLIALLEEKTKGNLTDDEQKFTSETLYQLRLAYVEMAK